MEDKFSFFMEGTNGKAVLLVHGLTGTPAEMRYLGKYFNRQGYTVYCPLLAGHCVDEKHILNFKWPDWVQSVKEAHAKLAVDYKDIYAAGICAGGMMALNHEAHNPGSFKGIALYSMTLRYDGWNITKIRHLNFLLPLVYALKLEPWHTGSFHETEPHGIKSDRIRKKMVEAISQSGALPGFPYRSLTEMYFMNDATIKLLPKMQTPVVIFHAREDDISHLRNMDKLAKKLGREPETHILEDSYHMIHVDQEKDFVAQTSSEFFAKHG